MDGSRSVFAFLASPREYLDFMALNDSLQSHWFGFDENSGSFVALKWVGTEGSDATDPLKAHQTTIFSWKGFRMNPSNPSELVC